MCPSWSSSFAFNLVNKTWLYQYKSYFAPGDSVNEMGCLPKVLFYFFKWLSNWMWDVQRPWNVMRSGESYDNTCLKWDSEWNSGAKRNRSSSSWLSNGQSNYKRKPLEDIWKNRLIWWEREREWGEREKKTNQKTVRDWLAQCGIVCHLKLEQVYDRVVTPWRLTMNL